MSDKVLILTDGKAGHENQSKAFARALGFDYDLLEVHFKNRIAKAFSYLLDRFGVRSLKLFDRKDELQKKAAAGYRAVLGTGSGTFYAAKAFARAAKVPCGVVLFPRGYDLGSFDCILAPTFDRPPRRANVIELPANLVAADAAFYEKGTAAFRERTSVLPEISVIIGGPNKCSKMTCEWMKTQLDRVFAEPGLKAVTTSRRTPKDVEDLIASYPWDYALIYSKDHFNPIPAFVSLSKKLFVSAESTGMLSEACTFGSAEVVALDNLNPGKSKFRRFIESLTAEGYLNGTRKIDLSEQFAHARSLLNI